MNHPSAPPQPDVDPFEKTFRLVCRLEDEEIDYVRDTSTWIHRLVTHVLVHDPAADPEQTTAVALDMSTRGRWRLMRPEVVAEGLLLRLPQEPAQAAGAPEDAAAASR